MEQLSLREYAGIERTEMADKYVMIVYRYLMIKGADMQGFYEIGGQVHMPVFGPKMYTYRLAAPADIYKLYLANKENIGSNDGKLIELATIATELLGKNE